MKKKDDKPLSQRVYELLKKSKKKWTYESLSDHFDVAVKKVRQAIQELHDSGKNVSLEHGIELLAQLPLSDPTSIDVSKFKGKEIKFGLTADNHLCSKYSRLDVLNALFDIWKEQGIKTVYQLGNMIDGEARFNKFDLLTAPGIEAQVDYFVANWPQRDGMTTEFITGDDHEGWYIQREGVNVGRIIEDRAKESGRNDLKFLGHMEHDIKLVGKNGQSFMRLIHAGGGSAYATSYSVQKIVESYQGGEKPTILLVGHYHKAEYGYPREVHVVQAGATEDQTPFMRKLKIQAHVGGWTITFTVDDDGIVHGFTPQWHSFFDRDFYDKSWKYRWK